MDLWWILPLAYFSWGIWKYRAWFKSYYKDYFKPMLMAALEEKKNKGGR